MDTFFWPKANKFIKHLKISRVPFWFFSEVELTSDADGLLANPVHLLTEHDSFDVTVSWLEIPMDLNAAGNQLKQAAYGHDACTWFFLVKPQGFTSCWGYGRMDKAPIHDSATAWFQVRPPATNQHCKCTSSCAKIRNPKRITGLSCLWFESLTLRDRIQLPRLLRYPLPPDCLGDEPEDKQPGKLKSKWDLLNFRCLFHVISVCLKEFMDNIWSPSAKWAASGGGRRCWRFSRTGWGWLKISQPFNGICGEEYLHVEISSQSCRNAQNAQDFVMDLNRGMHMTQISGDLRVASSFDVAEDKNET